MRTFLFCWNPNKWDWETLSRDAQSSATGKLVPDSWSCFNRKVQPGDRAFLMMLGRENRGIIASGWATSETYLGKHWDPERARRGEKCYRADCDWERLIDPDVDSPLFVTVLQKKLSAFQFGWTPQASGIRMPDELAESLEKLWAAHAGAFTLSIVDADEELRVVKDVCVVKFPAVILTSMKFTAKLDLITPKYITLNRSRIARRLQKLN